MIVYIRRAAANLLAHRAKSTALIAAIALGTLTLMLTGGYHEFNHWGLAQSLTRSQYGHLQLHAPGYKAGRDKDPFAAPLPRAEELLEVLAAVPGIRTVAPRALAWAVLDGKQPVEVRGIDPARESEVYTFQTARRGRWLSDTVSGEVMASTVLTGKLGKDLGDSLSASAVGADLSWNALDLKLTAVVDSYMADMNQTAVFVTRHDFAELFQFDGIQEIVLILDDESDPGIEAMRQRLQPLLAAAGWDLELSSWKEEAPYFAQVVTYYQGFFALILAVVVAMVFFATNTVLGIIVHERSREFGTRLALGASRQALFGSIILETLLAALAGLALGLVLAAGTSALIDSLGGIVLPAPPGMGHDLTVQLRPSTPALLAAMVCAGPLALLSASIPARRVLAWDIVRLLGKNGE